ncbi:hypothetical protein QW060_16115 [Myroides ceti]|uniref:SH3 domain-containing protein n=1 Tax=Paenimyroides ceti TaxID=395087 RepID=A0ABT8CVU4_9FLAO|nr:hypothetical protein [Paenimyroides ceti]MDN3708628.1 hypothetical protein [Paenimyroides ceti]
MQSIGSFLLLLLVSTATNAQTKGIYILNQPSAYLSRIDLSALENYYSNTSKISVQSIPLSSVTANDTRYAIIAEKKEKEIKTIQVYYLNQNDFNPDQTFDPYNKPITFQTDSLQNVFTFLNYGDYYRYSFYEDEFVVQKNLVSNLNSYYDSITNQYLYTNDLKIEASGFYKYDGNRSYISIQQNTNVDRIHLYKNPDEQAEVIDAFYLNEAVFIRKDSANGSWLKADKILLQDVPYDGLRKFLEGPKKYSQLITTTGWIKSTDFYDGKWIAQKEETPDYRLEIYADDADNESEGALYAIRIIDKKSGKIHQVIHPDFFESTIDGASTLNFIDVNFDGYPDIQTPIATMGSVNYVRNYYVYNPKSHLFEFDALLSDLSQIEIDVKNQQIKSYSRGGAGMYQSQIYQYVNGKLTLSEETNFNYGWGYFPSKETTFCGKTKSKTIVSYYLTITSDTPVYTEPGKNGKRIAVPIKGEVEMMTTEDNGMYYQIENEEHHLKGWVEKKLFFDGIWNDYALEKDTGISVKTCVSTESDEVIAVEIQHKNFHQILGPFSYPHQQFRIRFSDRNKTITIFDSTYPESKLRLIYNKKKKIYEYATD